MPEFNHKLEGPGVDKVPNQNAGGVAPERIGRELAPAEPGAVHDVVVEEGSRVQKLDDRRELHPSLALCRAGIRCQQNDKRTQALAASLHKVLANLLYKVNVRSQSVGNECVDG